MKILLFEPGKAPREETIENTLRAMQETVGGFIQAVYPWDDPVAVVCDEEGLLKNAPFNRMVAPEVAIFGTFFICGLGEEDFDDLPDEMLEKYKNRLQAPEVLFRTPVGNVVINKSAFDELIGE